MVSQLTLLLAVLLALAVIVTFFAFTMLRFPRTAQASMLSIVTDPLMRTSPSERSAVMPVPCSISVPLHTIDSTPDLTDRTASYVSPPLFFKVVGPSTVKTPS